MVKVKISKKAADCIAYFVEHPYYGEGKDISTAIIALTEEWFTREPSKDRSFVNGSFKLLTKEQRK